MHEVQQLDNWALWAEHNPRKCPCKGAGWLLSDFDTWHHCGLHGVQVPHPEDDGADRGRIATNVRNLRTLREAWRHFCRLSGMHPKAFRRRATASLPRGVRITPQHWVDAAEEVAETAAQERREAHARKQGYTCDLELRWAEEAAEERKLRMGYH